MEKRIKADEDTIYTCTNCSKTYKADKNSASITAEEIEIHFCSSDCLRQYWTK